MKGRSLCLHLFSMSLLRIGILCGSFLVLTHENVRNCIGFETPDFERTLLAMRIAVLTFRQIIVFVKVLKNLRTKPLRLRHNLPLMTSYNIHKNVKMIGSGDINEQQCQEERGRKKNLCHLRTCPTCKSANLKRFLTVSPCIKVLKSDKNLTKEQIRECFVGFQLALGMASSHFFRISGFLGMW